MNLKIATWNLARPGFNSQVPGSKARRIMDILSSIDGDIFILTETNSSIDPNNEQITVIASKALPHDILFEGAVFGKNENRATIWSKFPEIRKLPVKDEFTSVCSDLETPLGVIRVYGTIIGTLGHKKPWFDLNLNNLEYDCSRLAPGSLFILAGDFNISFSDSYYTHKEGRKRLKGLFEKYGFLNLTESLPENIDHIICSQSIIENFEKITADQMTLFDKTISDHKWASVTLSNFGYNNS